MQRDVNTGKARFDLIMPMLMPYRAQLLTRWAELMGRGAEKYDARNWEQAATLEELERFRESAFRHFLQWLTGETDEDHAAAVLFNISGAEYVKWRLSCRVQRGSRVMSLSRFARFFRALVRR
jgi:hypothetical protein